MRNATQLLGASLLLLVCGMSPSKGQEPRPTSPPTPVLPRDVIENGPPAQRPADDPGVPPADNLFFVPGEYVPQAGQIQWRPGYWTEAQPGWNWVPDRWIRRSSGWSFVEGNWEREHAEAAFQIQPQAVECRASPRTRTARPGAGYRWSGPCFRPRTPSRRFEPSTSGSRRPPRSSAVSPSPPPWECPLLVRLSAHLS